MEEFRDIPGYEGLYQVSNMGRVKSLPREVCNYRGCWVSKEKILKTGNTKGYMSVVLQKDNIRTTRTVHQLVAVVFLNHTPCGLELVIDHINDNPSDNRLENLQIVTQRFNVHKTLHKTKGRYSSKYEGVTWIKSNNKWRSGIMINGKHIHLGLFKKEFDAHVAYQNKLLSLSN